MLKGRCSNQSYDRDEVTESFIFRRRARSGAGEFGHPATDLFLAERLLQRDSANRLEQ